ncbi:tetratricopeptide repeat protein 13 [Lingula anatina]|uniref:Tetratricopeptide repeat protein 13 n=1 Tax=Lingula anatina TaxID=7574 RepID=A0A1S3HPM4_LINAN|nr:tetratricopeptide repeat protein 13 [Lingula anatina]|eukprot:XP_013386989.1 tetratricopeptide repeat protein 13 [Lingula anatina]
MAEKVLELIVVLLFIQISSKYAQQCDVASIHVTQEDGSQQVFRVKGLQLFGDCKECDEESRATTSRSTDHRYRFVLPISLTIGELAPECEMKGDVPVGLCSVQRESCPKEGMFNLEAHSESIAKKGLVPLATGNMDIDKNIAMGMVLMNLVQPDEAVQVFTNIIKEHPETIIAYHGRGTAFARKGLQSETNAALALRDFSKSIELDPKKSESYERRAEVLISLGQYTKALEDVNEGLKHSNRAKLYFLRGTALFLMQKLQDAEDDFRKALDLAKDPQHPFLYHLGLTLFYKGKVRNAIEVYKDALKLEPNHTETLLSLAQAFREIGNVKQARTQFNKAKSRMPYNLLTMQLLSSFDYFSGEAEKALEHTHTCLRIDRKNVLCQYLRGLSLIVLGQLYEGVKSHTKVMVYTPASSSMRMSPEFIKSHYLREYARYLHSHLDLSVLDLNLDEDFNGEFRDRWAKGLPFHFEGPYKEQPGLQPHIRDVSLDLSWDKLSPSAQTLICRANKIGWLTQVTADGFLPNKRLNLAMGLAATHIAQFLESFWRGKNMKCKGKKCTWRDIFDIGVQYRRLADPDSVVLWLDKIPEDIVKEGYKCDVNFVKGDVVNIRMAPYFDLVFKLVKTMLGHYQGEGVINYAGFQEDLDKAKSVHDILQIARKRNLNQQGFMVTTQVPSSQDKNNNRHEGLILTLTQDGNGQVTFSLNTPTTKARTASFHSELNYLFTKLDKEVRRTGAIKIAEFDNVLNLILSLGYYFYNLMPLSRGTSVVAYSVILGLFMSMGKEVTGKIPQGKLLDLEAMLSGGPDAFILVAKQWMNVKKTTVPVSQLPQVTATFPTVRSVIEALKVGAADC